MDWNPRVFYRSKILSIFMVAYKSFLFFLLLASVVFLLGCASSSSNPGTSTSTDDGAGNMDGFMHGPAPPASPPSGPTSVSIQNFAFNSANVTVTPGTTVTWTNNDGASHTVTDDSGAFESQTLNEGQSYSHAFNTAGFFHYHCAFHPSMVGTVTVKG